jgi:hypothetical protein
LRSGPLNYVAEQEAEEHTPSGPTVASRSAATTEPDSREGASGCGPHCAQAKQLTMVADSEAERSTTIKMSQLPHAGTSLSESEPELELTLERGHPLKPFNQPLAPQPQPPSVLQDPSRHTAVKARWVALRLHAPVRCRISTMRHALLRRGTLSSQPRRALRRSSTQSLRNLARTRPYLSPLLLSSPHVCVVTC